MKNIKLRAWDGDRMYSHSQMSEWILNHVVDPDEEIWELMQYTGRKDKNGKEIYGGDIVKSNEYPFANEGSLNYIGIVHWCDESLTYFLEIKRISDRVAGRACGGNLAEYDNLEVIGNIYENPELLEANNDL